MSKSHQFDVAPVGWPTDTPARRAKITITTPGGEDLEFALNAGELRRLVRTGLTGLGYTKVVRSLHGKQAGWENRIEDKVQPAMQVVETFFPKPVRDS